MQENQRDSVNALLGNGLFGGGGGGLDLFKLLRALLRRAWAVVMVGVVFAAAGYFFAKATYVPTYVEKATLEFTSTKYIKVADATGKEELVTVVVPYENNDISRYSILMKSDAMLYNLSEKLHNEYNIAMSGLFQHYGMTDSAFYYLDRAQEYAPDGNGGLRHFRDRSLRP